jgi:hypothetical protein
LAAGGAFTAIAAVTGWSFLWGLAFPLLEVSLATAVGPLLVGLAGVLLLTAPGMRESV